MNYTDISTRPGKGPRLHRNVSTKKYRDGWDRVFGKRPRIPRARWVPELPNPNVPLRCPECAGVGELPLGKAKVMCKACDGEGKVIYSD